MAEWDNERKCWVHEDAPTWPIPIVTYREDLTEQWWCTVHNRRATHICTFNNSRPAERCCNPDLGGIMLPCRCVKKEGSDMSSREAMLAVNRLIYSDRYSPRFGWHDDHRGVDGTPEYLPALQQVCAEYREFVEVLDAAGVRGGRCLQLGLGECRASHDAWNAIFAGGAVTLDWAYRIVGTDDALPGGDTHDPSSLEFARARGPYDTLFVDAGHLLADVRRDHADYGPMVRKGGIIAFHDALERPGHKVEVWPYVRALDGVRFIGREVGFAWVTA